MDIKRTKADKWFSDCVRARANWECEKCKSGYVPPGPQRKHLHCSHYVPRGSKTVRHFPFNAFSHCKTCHEKLGGGVRHISKTKTISLSGDPARFYRHYCDIFTADYAEAILRFSEITFKNFKYWEDDIADHYKAEFKRIDDIRMDGEQGRIEIEPWLGCHPLNFWQNVLDEVRLDKSRVELTK